MTLNWSQIGKGITEPLQRPRDIYTALRAEPATSPPRREVRANSALALGSDAAPTEGQNM
jgi:hypothetical protein